MLLKTLTIPIVGIVIAGVRSVVLFTKEVKMQETHRQNITNPGIWVRGLYMVLFALAYSIAEAVIVLLCIYQFFSVLITGDRNPHVLRFSKNVSVYILEILEFETFNSELYPFPLSPWPDEAIDEDWKNDEAPVEEVDAMEDASEPGLDEEQPAADIAQKDEGGAPDTDKH